MKLLRWLTVSMTREAAEASTELSPTGCTRRRAVPVPIGLKATVSTTHATAEAPTVLSLIGCTRLRAVSGILRTQRGRRGSGGAGQLAGTASAGPGQCGRPGPPSPSSHSLAPVAQARLSPLWLISGRHWASPTCHRPLVSSRAAYRRARSPARIATVVLAGCSGAGSGWCCRAWIAVCTVSLGGSATVGAGPLLCADSWAVTVWRIASAARLRQPRGHRAERGHPVSHQHGTTVAALSASSAYGAGRPG